MIKKHESIFRKVETLSLALMDYSEGLPIIEKGWILRGMVFPSQRPYLFSVYDDGISVKLTVTIIARMIHPPIIISTPFEMINELVQTEKIEYWREEVILSIEDQKVIREIVPQLPIPDVLDYMDTAFQSRRVTFDGCSYTYWYRDPSIQYKFHNHCMFSDLTLKHFIFMGILHILVYQYFKGDTRIGKYPYKYGSFNINYQELIKESNNINIRELIRESSQFQIL